MQSPDDVGDYVELPVDGAGSFGDFSGAAEDLPGDLIRLLEHPYGRRVASNVLAGDPDVLGMEIDAARRDDDRDQQSGHDENDSAARGKAVYPDGCGIHPDL